MQWDLITNIILITALITLSVFALLGLYQLITRKSLKKVDRKILAMVPPLALMAIIYFVFDKLWVLNVRPDGSGEPSFPSTHVMVVATIFFITILVLPKYIKNKALLLVLDLIICVLVAITATGRVLANKHWLSDVVAAIIFATIFAIVYYFLSKKPKQEKTHHA